MSKNLNIVPPMEMKEIREQEKYVEFGDKSKTKIIDLKWLCKRIKEDRSKYNMSPYITIAPLNPKKNGNNNAFFSFSKDSESGILFGIVNKVLADDNIQWRRINLFDYLHLNLNNQADLEEYAVIRYWAKLKSSPFQIDDPEWYIVDEEINAISEIEKSDQLMIALGRIRDSKMSDLVWFARILGINVQPNASPKVLKAELIKSASGNPTEFNDKFDHDDRDCLEVLHSASALGIISYSPSGGYKYRNMPLGGNEDAVINYFKEYKDHMKEIYREIKMKDTALLNLEKPEVNEEKPAKGSKKKNAEKQEEAFEM